MDSVNQQQKNTWLALQFLFTDSHLKGSYRKILSPSDQMPLNVFYSFVLIHIHSKPRKKFDHVHPNSSASGSTQHVCNVACIYTHTHTLFTHINVCVQHVFDNGIIHPVKCTPLIIVWSFSNHVGCTLSTAPSLHNIFL